MQFSLSFYIKQWRWWAVSRTMQLKHRRQSKVLLIGHCLPLMVVGLAYRNAFVFISHWGTRHRFRTDRIAKYSQAKSIKKLTPKYQHRRALGAPVYTECNCPLNWKKQTLNTDKWKHHVCENERTETQSSLYSNFSLRLICIPQQSSYNRKDKICKFRNVECFEMAIWRLRLIQQYPLCFYIQTHKKKERKHFF